MDDYTFTHGSDLGELLFHPVDEDTCDSVFSTISEEFFSEDIGAVPSSNPGSPVDALRGIPMPEFNTPDQDTGAQEDEELVGGASSCSGFPSPQYCNGGIVSECRTTSGVKVMHSGKSHRHQRELRNGDNVYWCVN